MTTLTRFLDRIANWKTLVVLALLYISFPTYWFKKAETTMTQLTGHPFSPIDLTMGFNPQRTLQMVADYGDPGRAYYARVELTIDIVYPLVYSLLLAVVLTLLFRNNPRKPFAYVALLPLVTLIADYLENSLIVALLQTYPAQSMTLAVGCELCKLVKWLSFGTTLLLILYGIVTRLQRKPASAHRPA